MRLRLSILTACVLGAAALLAAPAPAVLDGRPDGDDHPYVGKLLVSGPGPGQGQQCSGTLVAPTRVVTAAHCFINPATGEATNRNAIFTLQNPAFPPAPTLPPTVWVPGVAVLHPGFDAQTDSPYTDDVAVVELVAPYPTAVAAASIPRLQATRPMLARGARVDVVGWGATAFPPVDGAVPNLTTLPWQRHAATVPLLRGPDQPNHLRVPRSVCVGDSGGGFFDGDDLLAVTSVTLADDGTCDADALGYRVDTVSAQKFLADNGVPTKFSR